MQTMLFGIEQRPTYKVLCYLFSDGTKLLPAAPPHQPFPIYRYHHLGIPRSPLYRLQNRVQQILHGILHSQQPAEVLHELRACACHHHFVLSFLSSSFLLPLLLNSHSNLDGQPH